MASYTIGLDYGTNSVRAIPADVEGTALALKDSFEGNPAAMALLWKDHTSVAHLFNL